MKTTIIALALLISTIAGAQGKFEQGMGKAFGLWKEGKNTEAIAMFERIAAAEPASWLPNYYVALINTIEAFHTSDKEKFSALLAKAQSALDVEIAKDDKNPELMALQAMTYTAWIASDPMTYGMRYSQPVMELYAKASVIAPTNPRVVLGQAEFQIGGAQFFGTDIKAMCLEIDRAIELFATFKPESQFHPRWGLDRALEAQKQCKK